MTNFYEQYKEIKPYLISNKKNSEVEHIQSIEYRKKLPQKSVEIYDTD